MEQRSHFAKRDLITNSTHINTDCNNKPASRETKDFFLNFFFFISIAALVWLLAEDYHHSQTLQAIQDAFH